MKDENKTMSRREWLRRSAASVAAVAMAGALGGCGDRQAPERLKGAVKLPKKLPVLKTGARGLPLLSVSTMAMPKTGGKMAAECIQLVKRAADAGVRLFDTAWAYADGDGERLLGEALEGRSRDSYLLSSSMPTWSISSVDDARTIFDKQLQLLRADHIDYYSLQAISGRDKFEEVYVGGGVLQFLASMKKAGKISRLGVDYAGDDELLDNILSDGRFDFIRLPYNALDDLRTNGTQSSAIYAAQDAGKEVHVTNPTKEGLLRTLNGDATDVLYAAYPDRAIAGWALRVAAGQEGVATIIDSPADQTMLDEDVTALALGAALNDKEATTWDTALRSYVANAKIHCIDCKRCMPCPYGIDIPRNFIIHNGLIDDDMLPNAYGDTQSEAFKVRASEFTRRMKELGGRQSAFFCIGCGRCVARCPQGIAIPQQMAHISQIIDKARERAAKDICDK